MGKIPHDLIMVWIKADVYNKVSELATYQEKQFEEMMDEIIVAALGFPPRKGQNEHNEREHGDGHTGEKPGNDAVKGV